MTIQKSTWNQFIDVLAAIDRTAAKKFTAYLNTHDISSQAGRKAAIDYAAALADKYGESAAAMACEMYDAVAASSGVVLPAAEPAATATYGEVAKTVNGMAKQNAGNDAMGAAIGRMVKRTGVDTTMKNALRDGAQWAWIPSGDSCAFCLTLASRGWQRASKKALKNGHAEHIHSNCDCTYAIRFNSGTNYDGYDPEKYRKIYENAKGSTAQEKINSIRQELDAANREEINARKRELYALEKERLKQPVVTDTPKTVESPVYGHRDVTNEWLKKAIPNSHPVTDIESFVQDGISYAVDGKNVKFEYSDHEKEIAEILRRQLGGEIRMMPKVQGEYKGISTPDYIFRNKRYDLKDLNAKSDGVIYNAIHKKRKQADCFVINVQSNKSGLSREESIKQAQEIFSEKHKHTAFVKEIILIENGTIIGIYERK